MIRDRNALSRLFGSRPLGGLALLLRPARS
jgi:hypothetical protein